MAHVEKYGKGAMGHMMAHYDRSKDCDDNVDKERTHLNYNLAVHQQLPQLEFIHKRLSKVHVHNRKDVNVMCDWVVTAPKDFLAEHPDKERQFFESTYRFLKERYGEENIISAYVHRDETTPHMHFAFVPVVYDQKKDRYKVSAKECVTRADLQKFHDDLQAHVSRELQVEVRVQNGVTKEGNLTIPQLKAQTERADKLAKENIKLQSKLDSMKEYVNVLQDAIERNKEPYEVIKALEAIKPVMGLYRASVIDKLLQKHLAFDEAVVDASESKKMLDVVRRDKDFMEQGYKEEIAELQEKIDDLEHQVAELRLTPEEQIELATVRARAKEYDRLLQENKELRRRLGVPEKHQEQVR